MSINKESHKCQHVMIDVETLGIGLNAPIISIAAVLFNLHTGEYLTTFAHKETFYKKISLEENEKYNSYIEPETLRWWLRTDSELLYKTIHRTKNNYTNFEETLKELKSFCLNKFIWARSPSFDITHLKRISNKVGIDLNFSYKKEMDVRTLFNLYPNIVREIKHDGEKHDALSDCIFQIKGVCEIYKKLKINI